MAPATPRPVSDLTTLAPSSKWNHTNVCPLCLVSLLHHNVFKVHSGCSACQNFFPSLLRLSRIRLHVYATFCVSLHPSWIPGLLLPLAAVNIVAMNLRARVPAFNSLGVELGRAGIPGPCGNSVFKFLRNWVLFSRVAAPFSLPPSMVPEFHSLPALVTSYFQLTVALCFLAIGMCSLEKCLFGPLPIFFNWVLVFYCWVVGALSIFCI